MEGRLSSQITPSGQIRMSETPRNPGDEVRMITRLRNQIPRVRDECRAFQQFRRKRNSLTAGFWVWLPAADGSRVRGNAFQERHLRQL